MFFSKTKRKSILGIDIGTSFIKAVQLKKEKNGQPYVLESYGIVRVVYPVHPKEGKIDPIKQTAEVLKELHARSKFTTKEVSLSLPSNVAFVSVMELPPMPESEIQRSVEYKAKKYIPLPLSEVNLSWQILEEYAKTESPAQKNNSGKINILITAVAKSVVENYVRLAQLAGLDLSVLEIESLSTMRSLVKPDDSEGKIIIDIGAKSSIISLLYRGYLRASRHLSVGGDSITNSIAKSLGVSFDRAEQMKFSTLANETNPAVAHLAQAVLEIIKSETQQLIRVAENHGQKIEKVILTGGGSRLLGIENNFIDLVPKVERGNPLAEINYNPLLKNKLNNLAPQLAVAIGLAMRSG